ncbi:MAG: DMT family transporter [Bdellovibrionales bacterium]|nr:DMT family transporter [Bdellovibrionales bacterium]
MNILGPIGSFISSVTWAFGSTTYSHLSRKYPPSVVNFNRALFALPLYLIAIAITFGPENLFIEIAKPESSKILWLGLSQISSFAFGDALFLMAATRIGVPMSLTISSLYPVWSAFAGILFKGQRLLPLHWLGLVVIVTGVIVMIRISQKDKPKGETQFARTGILLAFATSLMWAFNTYGISEGAAGMNPLVANTHRMLFALPLCWIFGVGLGVRGSWIMSPTDYKSYGYVFAIEAFVGSLCFTYGLANSPLAVASALSSLSPVLAVPLAVLSGDERLSWKKTGLILMVTLGIIVLVKS